MTAEDLSGRMARLAGGERLTVIGSGRDRVADILLDNPDRGRGALLVACVDCPGPTAILDRLLDDLARLALDHWPHWHERNAPEAPAPSLSDPWLKAAATCARAGLPPRFWRMARELEFARLLRAIDPAGVLLVWEVDPACPARARPVIEALEWCARHGAAVVTALTVAPPQAAPYDRILYGAVALAHGPMSVGERFIPPIPGTHHASAVERHVAAALAQDSDLAGLFHCNAAVPVGSWGARVRVDLLCPAYRVVVELDGPEHRAEPKFSADRHRDFELLTAGYLVLRLTNDRIAADLAVTIEKIRAVVDLRRRPREGFNR